VTGRSVPVLVERLRRQLSGWQDTEYFVAAFAFVSALGGWFASAAPTGLALWDNVLTALFAAAIPLAASSAKRWSWLPLALAAAVLPGPSVPAILGVAALSVAGYAAFSDVKRNRMAGAFVGALSIQAMLRADEQLFFGFNSIVVAVVTGLVLYVGYQTATRDVRRGTRFAAVGIAVLLVVASLGAAGAIAAGRSTVERGVDSARSGLSAARLGDREGSLEQLAAAESSFDDAAGTFSAIYTRPASLVPVLAQHVRTLRVASREGRSVVSAARAVAVDADVQRLRPSGGAIDLALLSSMKGNLGAANDDLVAAEVALDEAQSRWLLPPLRSNLQDFQAELGDAESELDLANAALDAVPRLLGAERPFRYFVMFATPAESREMGGFLGAYAVLEASQGAISLVEVGNNTALTPLSELGTLDGPTDYPPWYSEYRLNKFPMNLPGTPDPLTVLAATDDLLPTAAGAPIDAIVYMDPFATEAFVGLVGQITIEGLAAPLDGTNTADFLLQGQYERYPDPTERTFDDDVNSFLRRVYLLRDFPRPDGLDFLSVVQANGAPTKLDTYMALRPIPIGRD